MSHSSQPSRRRGRTHRPTVVGTPHTTIPHEHHQPRGWRVAQIIRYTATGGSTSGENCIGSPGRIIRIARRDPTPPPRLGTISLYQQQYETRVRLFSLSCLFRRQRPHLCLRRHRRQIVFAYRRERDIFFWVGRRDRYRRYRFIRKILKFAHLR